jgi:hypothetical protein
MKRSIFAMAALAVMVLFGCDKAKDLATIEQDITYQESLDIPFGLSVPLQVNMDTSINYAFATNYQSYLNTYHTSSDKVISTKMKKLSMRITTPANQNFDFLDTVRLYVYAPGLPEVLAAYKTPVPKGTQLVDLDVIDVDLKQYFLKDSMYVRLNGFVNTLPQPNTNVNLSTTFRLKANPLN